MVNQTITFYANASSDVSGNLTFTIFFDYLDWPYPVVNPDSPVNVTTVNVTTAGDIGAVEVTYTYHRVATNYTMPHPFYWVQLFVNDSSGNNYSLPDPMKVYVSPLPVNMPPSFVTTTPPLSGDSGVAHTIAIEVADPDSDTVTVFWDFGDGTNATNVTVAPPTGVWVSQNHTWIVPRIPGKGDYNQNYTINMSLSDGHNPLVNASTTIAIYVPYNWEPTIGRLTASKSISSTAEPITFMASAFDREGDMLTWTFNFSDGTLAVYHTGYTAPSLRVWQNTTHSFANAGNYSVSVSVSDALVPFQVGIHNQTVQTTVTILASVAPSAGTIVINPRAPLINDTTGYVNATLTIQAFEPDGDMFNVTWNLGVFGIRTNISADDITQRMEPYTFLQVLTFNETGSYPIAVTITDGTPGHEVLRTTVVNVSSYNLPPIILVINHDPFALGEFATANESVKFNLVVTDPEHDAIEVIWNFGDGSPKQYMNLTDYDAKWNITVSVSHTYVLKGDYTMTVVVTDNKLGLNNHTLTWPLPIVVSVRPPAVSHAWDWWDFTSLALFMMIPISCIAWFFYIRRQRKLIENQGMTVDEWKIRKEMGQEGSIK